MYTCLGAAERLHEVQEQLKIAQAKMTENMSSALKKKEEVTISNLLHDVYMSCNVVMEWSVISLLWIPRCSRNIVTKCPAVKSK